MGEDVLRIYDAILGGMPTGEGVEEVHQHVEGKIESSNGNLPEKTAKLGDEVKMIV